VKARLRRTAQRHAGRVGDGGVPAGKPVTGRLGRADDIPADQRHIHRIDEALLVDVLAVVGEIIAAIIERGLEVERAPAKPEIAFDAGHDAIKPAARGAGQIGKIGIGAAQLEGAGIAQSRKLLAGLRRKEGLSARKVSAPETPERRWR